MLYGPEFNHGAFYKQVFQAALTFHFFPRGTPQTVTNESAHRALTGPTRIGWFATPAPGATSVSAPQSRPRPHPWKRTVVSCARKGIIALKGRTKRLPVPPGATTPRTGRRLRRIVSSVRRITTRYTVSNSDDQSKQSANFEVCGGKRPE